MSIDWSHAPEGATHWDTGMNNRVAGWMRLDGGIWYWWPAEGAFSCPKKWHASLNQHMVKSEGFIARPTYWTGEGLPPVGTVCEVEVATDADSADKRPEGWHKTTVLAHYAPYGDELQVAVCPVNRKVYQRIAECFRPIRTPEQIASDERETACRQLLKDCYQDENSFALIQAGRLYDAGWRKQASQ